MDLQERLDAFLTRLSQRARRAGEDRAGGDRWAALQDLFTRDVTAQDLGELVTAEPGRTYRFFSREVDFASLRERPRHQRWPIAAWRLFEAIAYRLSPARRVLFAIGVPILAMAWLGFVLRALVGVLSSDWVLPLLPSGLLVGSTLVCALLVLELRDKLLLKGDLEIARQIQFSLLPFEPYDRPGASIRALMRPANTVGGDYFDFVELPDGRLAVVIGDVAGKGMPAALLMALLQGSLRTLISAGLRGRDLMGKLNVHLAAHIPSNRLVTLFYGELDPATGRLEYVNAGHNAPFVLRAGGRAERLEATGPALGVVPGASYECGETAVGVAERLLLFTDGVVEAENPAGEEFGELRLEDTLRRGAAQDRRELIEGVREQVLAFCGGQPPRDDMTLLLLAR
jgi:serine phosphatase RsbU (regulator of sigma subunit)